MNNIFYHVVTERPMTLGQIIIYDEDYSKYFLNII